MQRGYELWAWPPKVHNRPQVCVASPSGTGGPWHAHSPLKTELLPLVLLSVLLKVAFNFLPLFKLERNVRLCKNFKTAT